jgi:TorA maturation chaperone TorD
MITEDDSDRADAYRILADIFSKPPDDDFLDVVKEDFELESKETGSEIRRDFDTLFVYPDGIIPPLESRYISPKNVPIGSVSEFYEKADLTMNEEFEYIPDHISLEFLFMSYLIETNELDLQENFLEEHIMNWVPHYCDEVIKKSGTVFYREIAGIAKNFIEGEYESFG